MITNLRAVDFVLITTNSCDLCICVFSQNLAGAARDGPSSYNMYPATDPDAQQDPHAEHPHSHSEADHDAIEQQLNDGDPSGTFQMPPEPEAGTARGGRKKRSDATTEDWTRIRKDNHVCAL